MACASRSHSIRFSSAAFAMAGLRVGLVKCSNRATGSMFRARRQVDAPDRMVDDRIAAPQHSLAGGAGGGGPMRASGLVERTGRRALVTGGSRGQIGRAHVCTPVTNAHLVCRLLLATKNTSSQPHCHEKPT